MDNQIKEIIVFDIKWNDCHVKLPTTLSIKITDKLTSLLDDVDGYADNLVNYLSDSYGYCIDSFCVKVSKV